MAPWQPGKRSESWASNPNVAIGVFAMLFSAWLGFQIWSGMGGPTPPDQLGSWVMAALGIAISTKTMEDKGEKNRAARALAEDDEEDDDPRPRRTRPARRRKPSPSPPPQQEDPDDDDD